MPEAETVFVHGDLWHGNTMWTGDSFVGMIDWDSAGAGHCGVDLGSIRLDAALMFGLPAAAEVLAGWQRATGREPDGTAYWDVVASLNTPADMVKPLPNLHAQGRTDLDAATLAARRDAFLQLALAALA